MNRSFCVLNFSFLILLLTTAAADAPSAPGRYQLIPARITTTSVIEGKVSSLPNDQVFKIDTATGDTWQWVSMQLGTKMYYGWEKCKDITDIKLEKK